jgi:hypothetical protein
LTDPAGSATPSGGAHVTLSGSQYEVDLPEKVPHIILPKSQFKRLREKLLRGRTQPLDILVGAGFTILGFGLASIVGAAVQWPALPDWARVLLASFSVVGVLVGVAFLALARRSKRNEVDMVEIVLEEMDDVSEAQGGERVWNRT